MTEQTTQLFGPEFKYRFRHNGIDQELQHAPDGWLDTAIEWGREVRHGTSVKYIPSLKFVLEGAEYLRKVLEEEGFTAKVYFLMDRWNPRLLKHEPYFKAQLKLLDSTDRQTEDTNEFECPIFDLGLRANIHAFEKTNYEIPLTEDIYIREGGNFLDTATWNVGPKQLFVNLDSYDIKSNVIKVKSYDSYTNHLGQDGAYQLQRMVREGVGDLKLKLTFDVNIDIGTDNITDDWKASLYYKYTNDLNIVPTEITIKEVDVTERMVNIQANLELTLTNEPLWIGFAWRAPWSPSATGTIKLEYLSETVTPNFSFKGISAYNLANELLNLMNGSELNLISDLMTAGAMRDIYLTSGDAIRGVENPVIKTNYADFWENMDNLFCISELANEANNSVTIEERRTVYDPDKKIIELGEVENVECEFMVDDFYNKLVVGGEAQNYQETNGRFEFNTETEFSTDLIGFKNEVNAVTKYRTDSFGVHITRYEHEQKATSDGRSDNDIFVIHATEQTFDWGEGENSQTITALTPFVEHEILGDEIQQKRTGIFNVYLSPKRCLMRLEPYLAIFMQKTNGLLAYQTITKTDASLISRLLGGYLEPTPVIEKEDYLLDLSRALHQPQKLTFTYKVPDNIIELMAEKNGGYISFKYKGIIYKGYPHLVAEAPVTKMPQQWTVYLSYDTPYQYSEKKPFSLMGRHSQEVEF